MPERQTETDARRGIAWSMQISLGNALSALSMIVMAVIFIVSIRSSSQLEMTELRGEMKVYTNRLEQLTRDFSDFKASTQSANAEVRQKLDNVSTLIGDMRVLIAGEKAGKR